MIYLDNSATTQMDALVLESMLPWLTHEYGNASSIHGPGRKARVAIEDARMVIANAMNAHPAEVTFTSGGTESNNCILKSCTGESKLADAVAVGSTEHHAVLHPAQELHSSGIQHRVIPVDSYGRVQLESVGNQPNKRLLISVMHANNETGVIQPLIELRKQLPDALIHSDAVQTFGKITVDVAELGVDFLSVSAHKIHGPKGVGAMFIRKGIDFKAHQQGGGQERNRRAGTEPVAFIVGFARAAELAVTKMEQTAIYMQSLISHAREQITSLIPNIRFNTPIEGSLPNILNVSFIDAERLDGESILQMMDMRGVCVSNGSACVSGSIQPSHVLSAMGLADAEAKAAVRISVSKNTTQEEIGEAVRLLSSIIRDLRG